MNGNFNILASCYTVLGYHVKKIIADTEKKIMKENEEHGTKMYLYSAHENNLAQLLILLDIKVDHVPTYGSYIVFEIHQINKTHGVKVRHAMKLWGLSISV